MGWEKEENYAKKRDLEEYTKKNTFNKKVTEIESSLETKITKDDLPDHSIYLQQKDLELYAKKGDLPKIPDLSPYAKNEDIAKDYLKKQDLPKPIDTSHFVKKEELPNFDLFSKKNEIFHCFVKLNTDFRIYDGTDWAFEFYMGNRGNWEIIKDTHDSLSKPENYECRTPFEGIFYIDFCFTCRRDTHLLKPHVLQRIRTKNRELVNFEYYDNSSSKPSGHDVFSRSFIKTCQLYLPKDDVIKFSMEFTNRSHNHKKQWLHGRGSQGGFTPTYFSVTGIRGT